MKYYEKAFVLWLVFGDHPFAIGHDPERWTDELSSKKYTLDDLYYEWLSLPINMR